MAATPPTYTVVEISPEAHGELDGSPLMPLLHDPQAPERPIPLLKLDELASTPELAFVLLCMPRKARYEAKPKTEKGPEASVPDPPAKHTPEDDDTWKARAEQVKTRFIEQLEKTGMSILKYEESMASPELLREQFTQFGDEALISLMVTAWARQPVHQLVIQGPAGCCKTVKAWLDAHTKENMKKEDPDQFLAYGSPCWATTLLDIQRWGLNLGPQKDVATQ